MRPAEICDLRNRRGLLGHEPVLGLDVTMHDGLQVHLMNALDHVTVESESIRPRERGPEQQQIRQRARGELQHRELGRHRDAFAAGGMS